MGKNNKKADMSIWIIVTAALALMVLVILAAIFTGQTRRAVSTLESCAGVGGRCTMEVKESCLITEVEKSGAKCQDDKLKCCIKVFEK